LFIETSSPTTAESRISLAVCSQKVQFLDGPPNGEGSSQLSRRPNPRPKTRERGKVRIEHRFDELTVGLVNKQDGKLSQHQSAEASTERSLARELPFTTIEARARKGAEKGAKPRAYRYSDHERGYNPSLLVQLHYKFPHHGIHSIQSSHGVANAKMALDVLWTELHEIQEYDVTQNMAAKIERDQLHGVNSCQKQLAMGAENVAVHAILLHD